MGKSKKCNILKNADHRAKRMKIWDSRCYVLYTGATFHVRFLKFSLGSFGALCKISDVKIFERLLFP